MDKLKYLREKQNLIAPSIKSKVKIYLDTKYWLIFRDIKLGQTRSESDIALYELIVELVNTGHAVCPHSPEVLSELRKQTDSKTLSESIKMVDRLSTGISFIPIDQRLKYEVKSLYDEHTDLTNSIATRHSRIWTKSGYWSGIEPDEVLKEMEDIPDIFAASFIDFRWSISLTKILEKLGHDNFVRGLLPFDVSSVLNDGKFSHAEENKSYKQMYKSELGGVVDVYEAIIKEAMTEFSLEAGFSLSAEEIELTTSKTQNMIYHGTNLDKISLKIPTVHILASIHAITRWDKNRKYKANDYSDFNHAIYALPYCDIFITEKSLASLLNSTQGKLAETYKCIVESNSEKALEKLNSYVAKLTTA